MRQWWRLFGTGIVCVALAAFTSSDALGQKNKKKAAKNTDPGYPATDADYAKIKTYKNLSGKILSIDSASKSVTMRVQWQHYEPNPKYRPPTAPRGLANTERQMYRTLQNLQRQQQRAMTARTPQQLMQAMNTYQMDMYRFQQQNMQFLMRVNQVGMKAFSNPNNAPFKVVADPKDYTFDVEDAATVRKMFLGTEYDDTGNLKKYTEAEKAELRGPDKSKPGYKASIEEVQNGQEVKLYITPPKKKTTKSDDDTEPQNRGTVNMVVMTKELTADSSAASNARKK